MRVDTHKVGTYYMEVDFKSEYLNQFWDSDETQALRAFAREYHERTEAYDQLVCQYRDDQDVAVSCCQEESYLCGRNALNVRNEIMLREGLDRDLFDKAIRDDAARFDWDWRAGLYNHLKR